MTKDQIEERIAYIDRMIAARTINGSPRPGYKQNVAACQAEAERLRAELDSAE